MWSVRNPEGGPMPQTFGSSLDAADEARKAAKENAPGPMRRCPVCERRSERFWSEHVCPFCEYGGSAA